MKQIFKKLLTCVELLFYIIQIPLTIKLCTNLSVSYIIFWLDLYQQYPNIVPIDKILSINSYIILTFFVLQFTYFINFLLPKISKLCKELKQVGDKQ